ncbi:MAG: TadE/TadG family type IV pilus assembly protein [Erythrobacter sp.]
MMDLKRRIAKDKSGVGAIEFAIAAPVLFALIFGIWNTGLILYADNSIRSAVETGARQATIFPRPTEAQIRQVINDRYYGPRMGAINGPTLAYTVQNGAPVVTITMSYTHETVLPFLDVPPLLLQHQRTVYLAPTATSGS